MTGLMKYFEDAYSAGELYGDQISPVLKLIADRYIADNPAHPFAFHCFRKGVFGCRDDGRFVLDMNEKFPNGAWGDRALAETRFWQERDRREFFAVNCFGPVRVEIGGESCFQSGVAEEVNRGIRRVFSADCKRGWNTVRIFMQKTKSGYGCIFGVKEPKWRWKPFFSAVPGQEGQLGFRYALLDSEDGNSSDRWLPLPGWQGEKRRQFPAERIFGHCAGQYVYACALLCMAGEKGKAVLELQKGADTEISLWLDGKSVPIPHHSVGVSSAGLTKTGIVLEAPKGTHLLAVQGRLTGSGDGWGWNISPADEDVKLKQPVLIHGTKEPWMYLGPFSSPRMDVVCDTEFNRPYMDGEIGRYYRLDEPETAVRPVLENPLFAQWNYPLGVTLYGLMAAARYLKDDHILDYVREHIGACVGFYRYSQWDKEEYGYPEINAQLVNISMLDDCGSFAGAMLELMLGEKEFPMKGQAGEIADRVARYMEEEQERRPDGAFYRICKGDFMEDTLWADDLYMSVPFLCRYYRWKGDGRYLDDAVNQFLRFEKYLYMEDENLMSHVYSFRYDTFSGMPWGRGNGWVLFSLSELLSVLPETHPERGKLLSFFRRLSDGYMDRQGADGMWNQLLSNPDSYEEASCTAMFVYGLSRGVRCGWFERGQAMRAKKSALRGWMGLTHTAIDGHGNVYGVCEGSAWSFKPEYYTKELGWVKNDPHGTGIVMLAGMEVQRMQDAEG